MLNRILATGLIALAPLTARADLVVLQYHHISEQTPASTSTTPELFRSHLARIGELGLEVVPLESATRAALDGTLNDQEQVAITFDDAYASVWSTAAPLLDELGLPYTIFVNTEAVGREGYMTWAQLKEARARTGVTIANHSHDHGHLARRPDESQQAWHRRASDSLDRAKAILDDRLGDTATLFAYPYGEYDSALEEMLDERNWLAYGQQSGPIGEGSDESRLPRFPMATPFGQLSSLNDKLRSRALPVDTGSLPDGIIDDNPPTLILELPEDLRPGALTCFGSGQGRLPLEAEHQAVTVQAPEPFGNRRFRYNCTYPAGEGRYYWFSQQWVDLSRPED
ncbi:polysaccharide deacetylase family protein [Marinobacter bryozoorum]|uniref:polysaccharide deacetylase family protein n=1 Tax=Marinobacter bryozoorum TaxID=256324 RepID=UPI002002BA78|nr:polysaccharide deacetylase family protein [Marinobacter bryozoorum]MCK7543262.1 polysaccharide deacetylase family protein [Marinobacter bryozoorum]